jgi:large subunit ribosomal protein L13
MPMVTVLNEKSTRVNKGLAKRKWLVIDATGLVLGRLASDVATILMGKHKPDYTSNVDCGDFVLILNAEKVKVTGKKLQQESYDWYTYYPGGHKSVSWEKLFEKHPDRLIKLAVRRMLPKNRLARAMFTKLKIVKGADHKYQAQTPIELDLSAGLGKGLKKLIA